MPSYEPDSERKRLAFWLYPQGWPTSDEQEALARALFDPRRDASIESYDPFGNPIGSFGPAPPSSSPPWGDDWEHRTPNDPSGAPVLPTDALPETGQSNVDSGGTGLWGAGRRWVYDGNNLYARGGQHLIDNPILRKQWESTVSAWTNEGGFSPELQRRLSAHGIAFDPNVIHPIPPGSIPKGAGMDWWDANRTNGALAEEAIANRYRAQGFRVDSPGARIGGGPPVDVVVHRPAADPRYSERWDVESKAGYTTPSRRIDRQIARDAADLEANRVARQFGHGLEDSGHTLRGFGKVARPIGALVDLYDVFSGYRADGNRIGENTGRAASGAAGGALGGWGGAALGAGIGTAILPGAGTLVGGIVGGLGGGWGGSTIGPDIFDKVRSWY